jgi:hypothetical protein
MQLITSRFLRSGFVVFGEFFAIVPKLCPKVITLCFWTWICHMKRPFVLKRRGKYWYYRLANQKTYHSPGQTLRSYAEDWIINKHNLLPEPKARLEKAEEASLIDFPSSLYPFAKYGAERLL